MTKLDDRERADAIYNGKIREFTDWTGAVADWEDKAESAPEVKELFGFRVEVF